MQVLSGEQKSNQASKVDILNALVVFAIKKSRKYLYLERIVGINDQIARAGLISC